MKLKKLLGIPKSLYFNLYYFPLKTALQFPVILAPDVKLKRMGARNSVKLMDLNKRIFIGYGESFALGGKTYWDISKQGNIVFNGSAMFGKGTQIIVGGGY